MMASMKPTEARPPSFLKALLFAFLWLAMWFWAIAGTVFVVEALVGLFFDFPLSSMQLADGESVQTTGQKIQFLAIGGLMATAGIGFHGLRRRGYFQSPV